MVHLLHPCRQFGLGTTVDDMHLGAETQGSTRGIHSHVAATDHGDFLADIVRGLIAFLIGEQQVVTRQELVGRNHAAEVLARHVHHHREASARADKHSLKAFAFHQLVDGDGAADDHVFLKLGAQLTHTIHLFLHDGVLRQTERRNAIHQHTAQLVQGLEDGDVVTHGEQVFGAGQA